jgi:pilus assembly protein CpaE
MGREIFWQLPNDYKTMVEVRNNGVPLIEQAPRAGITQAVIALAESLAGELRKKNDATASAAASAKPNPNGGWLAFLSGKGKGK